MIKTKPFYKRPLFWALSSAAVSLIVLAIGIGLFFGNGSRSKLTENPYEPEDFTEANGYLTGPEGQSVLGIDISQWQGDIDWQQVADAGVKFALIRVGGRGTGEEGKLYTDDNAQKNYEGATNAGVAVGCYFFSQAITEEEAIEEAQFLLEQVEGWEITMPIVCDWEYMEDSRAENLPATQIMACVKAFCDEIAAAGHTPMVYFNRRMIANGFDLEQMADYHFWLAQYDTEMDFPYRVDMWQYSASGSVPGISGNVDMNLYFPREEK